MLHRHARLGFYVYEVRLPSGKVMHLRADSVTINPSGALILSAEVPALPEEVPDGMSEEDGDVIENAIIAAFASGQWQTCMKVTDESHEPEFDQAVFDHLYGGDDDDDEDGE